MHEGRRGRRDARREFRLQRADLAWQEPSALFGEAEDLVLEEHRGGTEGTRLAACRSQGDSEDVVCEKGHREDEDEDEDEDSPQEEHEEDEHQERGLREGKKARSS